jgi:KaiC/GvpD/RAD55 family RecA-like ATPase
MTQNPTLDDALGGVLPGRIHLLMGPPGSGKTAACLHFLKTGTTRRERSVFVTPGRGTDLRSLALYVGVDLHSFVRDRRITVLRFGARFAQRVAECASPRAIVDELQRQLELNDLAQLAGPATPLRIVVDPVSHFVPHADTTGAALDALVEWLEKRNATALLTWTGDMAIGVDRRLEPLVERAAMILQFERVARGSFRAHVVRARDGIADAGPIAFQVVPGLGIATSPVPSLLHQSFPDVSGEQPAA